MSQKPTNKLAVLATVMAVLAIWNLLTPPLADADRQKRIMQAYSIIKALTFGDVAEITPAALFQKIREDNTTIVVDARTDEERAVSTLPGAMTPEQLKAKIKDNKFEPIYVYCTVGWRSGKLTASLIKQGLRARNLRGGILAWTHAHLPLVAPDGSPTKRVHIYQRFWNLAATGYDPVY